MKTFLEKTNSKQIPNKFQTNSKQIPNKFNFWLILVFFLTANACSEKQLNPIAKNYQESFEQPTKEQSVSVSISVNRSNEFLEFKDEKQFYETLANLSQKSTKEQSLWSKQFGVNSLRSIYDQVVEAENALLDATNGDASKLSKEQQKILETYGFASETALKNKDVITYNRESGFDMKIYNPHVSLVVNRYGIVKIGKEIRQYSDVGLKTILDGDESKIPLLDDIQESDESRGIRVEKAERVFSNGRVETNTRTLFCENIYYGNPWLKILTYDEFYVLGAVGTNTKFTHYQKTRSLRKGFLGAWYDYVTTISRSGEVNYKDNTNTRITSWNGGYFYGGHPYAYPYEQTATAFAHLLTDALLATSRTPITPYGQTLSGLVGFVYCGSIY